MRLGCSGYHSFWIRLGFKVECTWVVELGLPLYANRRNGYPISSADRTGFDSQNLRQPLQRFAGRFGDRCVSRFPSLTLLERTELPGAGCGEAGSIQVARLYHL